MVLGIDHNIFPTTRIREEAGLRGTRRGVVTGLATTGAVITSAGLVLAGTFAALGTLPMVAFAEIVTVHQHAGCNVGQVASAAEAAGYLGAAIE